MTRCLPTSHRLLRAPGFTLVELLASVAIIAILVALGFTAMSRAREQASAARCSSNIRQLHLLARSWAADNDGWCPQAMWSLKTLSKPYTNLRNVGLTDEVGKCGSTTDPSPNYGINAKLVLNPSNNDGGQWGKGDVYYYSHGRYRFTSMTSSKTIIFAETAAQSWSLGKAGAYISAYEYLGTPHKGRGYVAYMDGHVELKYPAEIKDVTIWTAGLQ